MKTYNDKATRVTNTYKAPRGTMDCRKKIYLRKHKNVRFCTQNKTTFKLIENRFTSSDSDLHAYMFTWLCVTTSMCIAAKVDRFKPCKSLLRISLL